MFEHRRPDVAVFIDFENVYVSVRDKLDANPNFETIMDRCNDLGRVVIARAYADWYRYPRITSALYANSIEPMYVPTYYYDKDMGRTGRAIKNSVDMNLCIDVMKTLFTNTNIGKFVLATGDRDFIPLVNSIRQQGKEVIVIGIGGAASAHLAQSADEFIFYEQLVGKTTAASQRSKTPAKAEKVPANTSQSREEHQEPDVYDVLVEAIHLVRERGYVSTLGSIKLVMKELMGGDFKENRYRDVNGRPFTKFKEFVIDAERRGRVQIYTSGTVNEVFLPGEDPLKLSQFAGEIKEEEEPSQLSESASMRSNGQEKSEPNGDTTASTPSTNSSGRSRRRRRPRKSKKEEKADVTPQVAEDAQPEEAQPEDVQPEDVQPEDVQPEDVQPEDVQPEDTAAPSLDESAYDAALSILTGDENTQYDHALADALAESAQPREYDGLFERMLADATHEQNDDYDGYRIQQRLEEASTPPAEADEAEASEGVAEVETPDTLEAGDAQEAPAPDDAQEAPAPDDAASRNGEPIHFEDQEWEVFRTMMAEYSRPISFSQMVENMKKLRNDQAITRTNEQIRTLCKQAIHNGMLERTGRGSRIYYKLKTDESDQD